MTGPAVILMAYGSPDRLADVPAYYSDIRGGRPIRPELVEDLVARYRALGIDDGDGPSPLNAITEETRAALEAGRAAPGHIFNLGHGVIPSTDPDQLARLTDFVQSF